MSEKKEYLIGVIKNLNEEKKYGFIDDGKEEKGDFIFGKSNLAEGLKFDDLKVGDYVYFVSNKKDNKKYANSVILVPNDKENLKGKIKEANKVDRNGKRYKHIFSENLGKSLILYSNFSINYLDGLSFDALTNGQDIFFKLKVIRSKNGYIFSVTEISKNNRTETTKVFVNNLIEKTSYEIINVLKNNLEGIKKGETFEDYCAIVLNLLGVEELYQYPRDKQAGRADGIIKAVGLDILYDCTLREDFENYKEMQIDNYVRQINQNTIKVEKVSVSLGSPKKQVWIITKGEKSETRSLEEKEKVKIKEINIEDLIELLSLKITNSKMDILDKLGRLGDME